MNVRECIVRMKLDGDKDLVWDNDLLLQLFIQDDDVVVILRY